MGVMGRLLGLMTSSINRPKGDFGSLGTVHDVLSMVIRASFGAVHCAYESHEPAGSFPTASRAQGARRAESIGIAHVCDSSSAETELP